MALSGLHLLLTYRCTCACDHCFVWGSPQATATMSIGQVRAVLDAAVRLGTVTDIYFEGGEPFLAHPLLVAGAREAVARGLQFGVVTNAYWATGEEDAALWLEPLAALGIADLSLSEDRFHGDLPSPGVRYATAAARRLGLAPGVLRVDLGPDCSAGGVRLRGRAAHRLAGRVRLQAWDGFAACPYEDLADPSRVHIDAAGYVHLCQGLAMGRAPAGDVDAVVAAYRPAAHPIVAPLLAGGPAALVREYALEHEAAYGDACHLCYHAREQLRPRFPQFLGPGQMYGEGLGADGRRRGCLRTLVIGYGNPSRRDDGVALHVVNALRARWGQAPLGPSHDGWDDLAGTRDTLFLQQLTPELAETLAGYDRVVFVDAALPEAQEAVRTVAVAPALRMAAVSHHMEPAALLALAQQLYGHAPAGWLVSVRGYDMDFGEALSPQAAAAVPQAAARVLALVETSQAAPGDGHAAA